MRSCIPSVARFVREEGGPVASAFDAAFRALRHYYRASGFPQESSTAAEEAVAFCSDAIRSAAKVGVGESGRAGPKSEKDALETQEGLFEKSMWMGGYSVAVLTLILEHSPTILIYPTSCFSSTLHPIPGTPSSPTAHPVQSFSTENLA